MSLKSDNVGQAIIMILITVKVIIMGEIWLL